jgi:hypothetical protein
MSERDVPRHDGLTPGEYCLLVLLCEHQGHGWSLATTLSRAGEIGSIGSIARPTRSRFSRLNAR